MGPLISASHRKDVEHYYEIADKKGDLLLGADLPSDPQLAGGAFCATGVDGRRHQRSSRSAGRDFRPSVTVIQFDTVDEAVAQANNSPFGLVAAVLTSNVSVALTLAERLRVGQVWINSLGVGPDVKFPVGGYKYSGFGREKGLEA